MPAKKTYINTSIEDGQLEIRLRSRLLGTVSIHFKSFLKLFLPLYFGTYLIINTFAWMLFAIADAEKGHITLLLTSLLLGASTALLFRKRIRKIPLTYHLSMTTICYFAVLLLSWPISAYGWRHEWKIVFFVLPDLGIVYPHIACVFLAHLVVTLLMELPGRKKYCKRLI